MAVLLAIAALILCYGERRSMALCLGFVVVMVGFDALAPSPAEAGKLWYVLCAAAELAIVALCYLLVAPASRVVSQLSMAAAILNIATLLEWIWTDWSWLYFVYGYMIPAVEIAQAFALLIFAPPCRQGILWVIHYAERRPPWRNWHQSYGPRMDP